MKITRLNPQFPILDAIAQGNDQSAAYHECYLRGERIGPMELENIGYRLTGRHIMIGTQYRLFELLPTDSSFRASHSFLAPNHRTSGVVIARTFNEHKAEINPVTAQARYSMRKSRAGSDSLEASHSVRKIETFHPASRQLLDKAM